MGRYDEALAGLNDSQREAVTTITGPVLVVAGPGTGKTQLLSVRVGNILKTDPGMLPGNILCLTFTDAAAANLRERLIEKIGLGQAAYQVAIHTFNSFGSWIMNNYPEYFFAWREAATADELTSYRVIETLLEALPGDHPLAGQAFDDSFFALKQIQNFIGDCKRANLSPSAARAILDANQATYQLFTSVINAHWPAKMTKDGLDGIAACIAALNAVPVPTVKASDITDLAKLLLQDLHAAAAESEALEGTAKTKPFTAFKNNWLELDADKNWTFKAAKHYERLRAATDIYEQYQQKLAEQGLVDFNDQIVTVLAALAQHQELRLNLQERFQYVMIDEYQDTNRAQLQMARYLTDAAVHEGRPNILVVGDDDQAIYRFQGADMSNIGAFEEAYRNPRIIRLDQNYRSNEDVVAKARSISTQITLSLEKLKGISKALSINVATKGAGTVLHEFEHETQHYAWVAAEIKRQLGKGETEGRDIAVLARQRSQLDALVPYLRDQGIPIDYERRENVLEQEHVVALLNLARVVQYLAEQRLDDANDVLPAVLSHPMWDITPADVWRVSRAAYSNKQFWLDVIFDQEGTRARAVADFLFELSQQAADAPLENILDSLIGLSDKIDPGAFISPFKNYYFGEDLFNERPAAYLTLLSHLACLRRHVRGYQQGARRMLQLKDLIQFADAYQRAGLTMTDTAAHREDAQAVRLMTTHKAKGQEFNTVFIIGANNNVWGKTAGSSRQRFSYPRNLQEIKPSDNDADDALRLLFVAMTRARQNLHICYFKRSEDGKVTQPFAPLLAMELTADEPPAAMDAGALATQYEQRWLSRHAGVDQADKQSLLADRLERYQLSATHFSNYLDVSRGGPLFFLTQNLLHFPSSLSPQACYGIIVHDIIRRAHEAVRAGQRPDIPALIAMFTAKMAEQAMSQHDRAQLTRRGQEHLLTFLTQAVPDFSPKQRVEVDFKDSGVILDGARLTGSLDMMNFNGTARTITVTDYKTGRPFSKWDLPASSGAHMRVKAHRYRQQLLFYKLLVDGSSEWGSAGWRAEQGILRFIDPDDYGKLRHIDITYEAAELERTKQLIHAVWQRIMALDFTDPGERYSPDLEGIIQFENDLLASQ